MGPPRKGENVKWEGVAQMVSACWFVAVAVFGLAFFFEIVFKKRFLEQTPAPKIEKHTSNTWQGGLWGPTFRKKIAHSSWQKKSGPSLRPQVSGEEWHRSGQRHPVARPFPLVVDQSHDQREGKVEDHVGRCCARTSAGAWEGESGRQSAFVPHSCVRFLHHRLDMSVEDSVG